MTTMLYTEHHNMKLREWIPVDNLNWANLAYNENPNAIHLLEQNLNKVNWDWLSRNPNAIHILEQNLNKLNWYWLSKNPNAIHILEQNLDKVKLSWLSDNPNIFIYDYKAMKDRMFGNGGIKEDLMKNRFHPQNLYKFKGWGFDGPDDDDEIE